MNINIEHILRALQLNMGKDVEATSDRLACSDLIFVLSEYHFLMTIAVTLYTYTNTNTVNIPEIQARIIGSFRDFTNLF